MALLEQIEKMRQSGQSDNQIVSALREQGYPSNQVNEAFSQLKIKSAIYPGNQENEELQPSIMQNQQYSQEQPQQEQVQYAPEQGQYQQQYQDYNQNYYSQAVDVETVRDIAKQESEEATKKIRQEVEALSKLKTDLKFEIQNLDNRLNKVESIMQELQSAIIRKMGDYGEAIQGISEEIKATQGAFSKMINPLLDKQRGVNSSNQEPEQQMPSQKSKQKPIQAKQTQQKPQQQQAARIDSSDSASFEDYFR